MRDGKRMTGGGATSGIDFSLALVGELAGVETAQAIQSQLEYTPDPPFDAGLPGATPPAVVAAVRAERERPAVATVRRLTGGIAPPRAKSLRLENGAVKSYRAGALAACAIAIGATRPEPVPSLMRQAVVVDPSPFGRYAPTGVCAMILRATRRCSGGWLGKRTAFFLRSIAIRTLGGLPVDVESVGAKMRLYPYNNVAEKRLLFTPQYFDPRERALLADRLRGDFVFLDVGASVGGYALSVAARAGARARILAVEPLPEVFERLVYNIGQNVFANVKAVSCALADRDGEITLFINARNRGEASVRVVSADARGARLRVPAKSLLSVVVEEGYERVDAIKLDIEGAEDLVLDPFFRDAPPALWPRLIVMEFALLRGGAQLEQRLRALGYCEILRTGENVAYERV